MDEFRLDVKVQLHPMQGSGVVVGALAFVNGQRMPECFDIYEFIPATKQSGRYALFTCSCGIFGCGGYWVDVECTAGAWVWNNGYLPYDADEPEEQLLSHEFEYHIPWDQVEAAITQVGTAIAAAKPHMPADWNPVNRPRLCEFLERAGILP